MPDAPNRRSVLRWAALGAAGLAGCRARGLDPAKGALPLASGTVVTPPASPSTRMPTAFVGHGSPMTMVDPAAGGPWTRSGQAMPRPRAILVVSAHWEQHPFTLGATTTTPLLYDFFGFPDELYEVKYPAPARPSWRQGRAARQAGLRHRPRARARARPRRVRALVWLYPKADVPVLQMSIPSYDPSCSSRRAGPSRRSATKAC